VAITVTKVGAQQTLNTQSIAITTTQEVTSGIIVVVVVGARGDAVNATATDNGVGLTYTLQSVAHDTSDGASSYILTAPVTGTLASGKIITVSGVASSNSGWQGYVYAVSECTEFDKAAQNVNAWRTTGHVTGTTDSITGTNDAAIAVVVGYNAATAFTSNWAGCTDLDSGYVDSRAYRISWKAVTSGTQAATFDTTAGTTSAAGIVVVKAAAGGGGSVVTAYQVYYDRMRRVQ
jgi:hypothetical protein